MDKDLLYYEMKKRKVSVDDLCAKIGISKTAFYRKCAGKTEFTVKEVKGIVKALDLQSPIDIFFADKVS